MSSWCVSDYVVNNENIFMPAPINQCWKAAHFIGDDLNANESKLCNLAAILPVISYGIDLRFAFW